MEEIQQTLETRRRNSEESSRPQTYSKFAFLFKRMFSSLQPSDETDPYDISVDELRLVHCCSSLSKAIYVNKKKRFIPRDAGEILQESDISAKYVLPYIIMHSSPLNTIIVCYRGSYCIDDYIVDLKCTTIKVKNGEYHAGVFLTTKSMTTRTLDIIHHFSLQYKCGVLFTGHSLGASVAAEICKSFKNLYPDIPTRAIIFAPASSLSYSLWEESCSFIDAYVLHGDFVPFLTLHNLEQVSETLWPPNISQLVNQKIRLQNSINKKIWEPIDVTIMPIGYNPFTAPPPPESELPRWDSVSVNSAVPLYPPGKYYVFKLADDNTTIELRKVRNCNYFGRFTSDLNEYMHMMGVYRDWIDHFVQIYINNNPDSQKILEEK